MIRFIAAAALFLGLTACSQEEGIALPQSRVVELSDQFTGDFSLINSNGDEVTDEDFEGKIMLVYFGFTHCPDVCPGDVGVMSAALNELGNKVDEVAPIFISVDPERDTPEALTDYFTFDERIIALTGSVEAAKSARDAFKLFAEKTPLPDSALEYTVNHGRFFYVTDRNGQPRIAMVDGFSPQELAGMLRRSIKKY